MSTSTSAATGSTALASSYRIKFKLAEFLKLISEANPPRIYKVSGFYYFAFDGFIMYCNECRDDDLMGYTIFRAKEFSNVQWQKT
jgi:hypothetical protein